MTTVLAASLTNDAAASRATGIPARTIGRWREDPEMSEFVNKTRDQLADEMGALAALALATIQRDVRAGKFEPRDLVMLMGVATEKSLLLSGAATSRTETRDITGTITDTELADLIREAESLVAPGRGSQATAPEAAG